MLDPVSLYRLSHTLYKRRLRFLAHIVCRLNVVLNGCDISMAARIGKNLLLFHHGLGVIIGSESTIGDNVCMLQNVTLGVSGRKDAKGRVLMAMPTIEDDVYISAGVKLAGGITIGKSSVIGANAVVTSDIPPHSLAVGIPAKVVKSNINRGDYVREEDLLQRNLIFPATSDSEPRQ